MSFFPSSEQVLIAYLRLVEDIDPTKISTSLPADAATWSENGFVQVRTISGSPQAYTPLYEPVMQVDCWANNVNSQKPPWGKASQLSGAILLNTYRAAPGLLGMPDGFYNVRLLSVYPVSEPRRIDSDEAGFARISFDLELRWVLAGVVL